mgnify:CR=1 FL=1
MKINWSNGYSHPAVWVRKKRPYQHMGTVADYDRIMKDYPITEWDWAA